MRFTVLIFFIISINPAGFSQLFDDKKYYLIDSLILENHDPDEVELLKTNLNLFHKTTNEIQKISFLSNIVNNSNDIELWPKYNNIIILKCQNLLLKSLKKQDEKAVLNFLTDAYNDKAYIIGESGNKKEAISVFNKAIEIAIKTKDKRRLLNCYNNIGHVYSVQGNIPIALKYTFLSLKIADEINDLEGIAIAYGNLGVIYDQQNDIEKSTEYYLKSLALQKKTGDKSGIATAYNNLGFVYNKKNDYEKAIYYYSLANQIYSEIEEYDGISASYSNIGSIYFAQNDTKNAILYFNKALEIDKKINNPRGIAHSYASLGRIYKSEKNLKLSKQYFEKALKLALESGVSEVIQTSSESLFSIYSQEKNWRKAFEMQSLFFQMKDSINNLSNQKEAITQALNYDFEKQQSLTKKENEKKLAVAKEKENMQRLIIIFSIFGFFILTVFSYFIFKRYKISQIQNIKIKVQKDIIEEKQKEINDSINYAERIQKSFLASEDIFQTNLSDYFILFKPKDVVSGDFYWAYQMEQKFYLCAADSTGHGIPGAFMSLLNISLLNEGLLSRELTKTNLLLDFVRKILILGLKPDEKGQGGNDGMDCALICIDFKTLKLEYSGAYNPLWIVRNNELIVIKADKMPVGRSPKQDVEFSLQEFQLKKNDSLFLFSDGFPDQFGGPNGKKFKYKAFEELLLQNVNLDMSSLKDILENTFHKWKGSLDQVDDVCVIGVRI